MQGLFEFIASDPSLKRDMAGKIYGGLAVGAKRNGGQETTLIYQMLDMLNMGLLAVGNGHETTAQYGGTAKAGDVGTFASDQYGLETCIGTGRRVARTALMKSLNRNGAALTDKLSVHLWLVQDSEDGRGHRYFQNWAKDIHDRDPSINVRIFDAVNDEVVRCLACEVCPTQLGDARDYRCIVTSADDFFVKHHGELARCGCHSGRRLLPRRSLNGQIGLSAVHRANPLSATRQLCFRGFAGGSLRCK